MVVTYHLLDGLFTRKLGRIAGVSQQFTVREVKNLPLKKFGFRLAYKFSSPQSMERVHRVPGII